MSRMESPQLLALIYEADVVTAFGDLANQMPENLPIDEFLDYFKSTWVEGTSIGRRLGRARRLYTLRFVDLYKLIKSMMTSVDFNTFVDLELHYSWL